MLELNFKGALRCCKAVLPSMIARGSGKIVNISSDSARLGGAGSSIYSSCKGAVISFTKSLALEVARRRINVNCVSPGPTETPLFEQLKSTEFGAKKLGRMDRIVPLGRTGQPGDIAAAVLFLASDEASFITGQTLSVSGGVSMV
jgi:2-hydroxycyclohexanecarboxyl-CoA dehydrogenase